MINIKSSKNKGFSLFELLIYVTILSIVMVVISNMFVTLSRGRGQSQAKSEINNAIRFASELIRQDVKNASSITTPVLGSTSSSLVLTRAGVTITYDTSAGALRRKEGAASAVNVTAPTVVVGTPVFTRMENLNSGFVASTTIIKANMVFSYISTAGDWNYSANLDTSASLSPTY